MIREVIKGWKDVIDLTCFRGPWAYEVMADVEAAPAVSWYDLGARAAVVMVRADEKRKYERRATVAGDMQRKEGMR